MFESQLEDLRVAFWASWAQDPEGWRVGRGINKLKGIDDSTAEDRVEFDCVKMMLKREVSTVQFDTGAGFPKKARAIQFTVNERTAYEYASFGHALSKAVSSISGKSVRFQGIDFTLAYCAEMNHDAIGQFATESEAIRVKFAFSCLDERDGKNWDANVQVCHRHALINIYESIDAAFGAYAREGVTVSGRFRQRGGGCLAYRVAGTVKSGHFDTSVGNGMLNREVSAQALASLPEPYRPRMVRGLIMGDDYLAWLYFDSEVNLAELRRRLDEAESSLGIHPERGLFLDVRCVSFISLTFYVANEGQVVALPKIGRMLCRLFWTVTDLQGRDPRRLAASVAQAFYPLYSTFPLMRSFLKHHMQLKPLEFSDWEQRKQPFKWWEMTSRLPSPIDWRQNHLVKYGPVGLLLDEVELPTGPQGAGLAHSKIVDYVYQVDAADPQDRFGCATRADDP